jgi:hypothetical protein
MRPIDASKLLFEIQVCSWDSEQDKERAEDLVLRMPTLTPPNEARMINADKLAKRIAGHSNYHGDSILAAIYCAAEGKESDIPIQPIETQPNEPLTLEDAKKERYIWFTPLNDWAKVTSFGVLFFGSEELMSWETLCKEWGYRFKAYRRPPEGEKNNG